MSITLNSATTNNADWKTQFQFTDGDTGSLIDFTGALIAIEVQDSDCCQKVLARTDNGQIAIISAGIIEINVPATTMETLRPGSYEMGGAYVLNGATISLFEGSLSIRKGIPKL